jgi:hypothetical protein
MCVALRLDFESSGILGSRRAVNHYSTIVSRMRTTAAALDEKSMCDPPSLPMAAPIAPALHRLFLEIGAHETSVFMRLFSVFHMNEPIAPILRDV